MKATLTILFLFLGFYSFSQQSHIDSLKNVLTTAKEDSNKVKTLIYLSYAHAWSNPDSGILYAKESISLAREIKYERGESFAYTIMGFCLTTVGNYPLALDYLYRSLEYEEKINSKQGQMWVYAGLLLAYRDMGEYQKSLEYAKKGLSLENPDVVNTSFLGGLASVHAKMDQPDSAIYYATIVLKLRPNSSGVLFVLGDSYYKQNRFDTANYIFDRGILNANINRTEIDLVDLYHGKSRVYKLKYQLDSAIIYARKAMLEPFGKYYPRGVLEAITTLSNLYEIKNQPDSTLKYLRASITLRDSLFNREKTMAIQNLAFKQQEKQNEIEALKLENRNRIRMNAMLGSLFTLTVIAFLLLKNNRNSKKANELLQVQKAEIEEQKNNVEQTLTELKSTQAQLIQSEKMASLGQLTAGIAHEIQNPLNFVNNFSEVSSELILEIKESRAKNQALRQSSGTALRQSSETKSTAEDQLEDEILEDIKQNLEKITHHGKRADAIVKSMLEHSRANSGEKLSTDINALADEYLRLSYHGMRAKDKSFNADFVTDFDQNLPKVNVVPQEIGRVLLNIMNNAFQACATPQPPQGGGSKTPTVTISTSIFTPLEGGSASPETSGGVKISISDNGPGIPDAIKDKIFQPFFTTKPTGQGTGLGLSLAYDIVKAHGGEVKVETKEGVGSEFIILLPVV